jgi:5,5'-dehydrodivanillate O-demethylase
MPDSIIAEERKVNARPVENFYDAMYQTGPETLGGKYLRQFWHPVAVSDELAAGTAKPIRLLSEEFTLYRGETGTVHLTEKHCPHRRTQLSVGYIEGDAIRCLYHGWKFGADGACVERPAEPGTASHIRIKTYAAREHLGLIFAYVGDGPEPAFPPFPAFQQEGLLIAEEQYFECNHFHSWENDWDLYHAAWTHKQGELHGPISDAGRSDFFATMQKTTQYQETDFGVVRYLEFPGGIKSASVFVLPMTIRLMIPTFNELARRGIGPAFRDSYIVHCPVDDVTHKTFITQIVPVFGEEAEQVLAADAEVKRLRAEAPAPHLVGRDILAGRTSLPEQRNHPVFVLLEDTAAQVSQGAIPDRAREMLGMSDIGVVYLRRLMAREFTLLEDGKPTTDWRTDWTMPDNSPPKF